MTLTAPAVLAGCSIFAPVPRNALSDVSSVVPLRRYCAGELVTGAGIRSGGFAVVGSGRIRLFRAVADGRTLTLWLAGPGDTIPELKALSAESTPLWAVALEPSTVAFVSPLALEALTEADPGLSARLARSLLLRSEALETRLCDTALHSVPARVALAIASADGAAGGGTGSLRLTHSQLADLVGTSRATVTKVLASLAERGLVELRRGSITVVDHEALLAVGETDDLRVVTGGRSVQSVPAGA